MTTSASSAAMVVRGEMVSRPDLRGAGRRHDIIWKSRTRLYPSGESFGSLNAPPAEDTAPKKKPIDGTENRMKRVMATQRVDLSSW